MLITLVKHKKRCQRRGCAVVGLALSMAGWLFTPASAEQECATDFFSQQTCRSFDALDRGIGQNSDAQERAAGDALWNDRAGLSGSQIWYRNPFDSDRMAITPRGWEALGNRAIHGFGCLIDLFGNVVCNRDQVNPEVPLDEKLPGQG